MKREIRSPSGGEALLEQGAGSQLPALMRLITHWASLLSTMPSPLTSYSGRHGPTLRQLTMRSASEGVSCPSLSVSASRQEQTLGRRAVGYRAVGRSISAQVATLVHGRASVSFRCGVGGLCVTSEVSTARQRQEEHQQTGRPEGTSHEPRIPRPWLRGPRCSLLRASGIDLRPSPWNEPKSAASRRHSRRRPDPCFVDLAVPYGS